MKLIKVILVTVLLLVNIAIAQPAFADPIAKKSPEYTEISEELSTLLQATNPEDTGYTAAELQQKISSLQFQKYIMETSEDWGICRNETGKTIGVYGHQPKEPDQNVLLFLGNGQETDDDWDCNGVYFPSGTNVAGLELSEPEAFKIMDGTRLVISANPATQAMEFNLSPAKAFKAGEASWDIPNLTQADIDAKRPDAPND